MNKRKRILILTDKDFFFGEPNGSTHAIGSLVRHLRKNNHVDLYITRKAYCKKYCGCNVYGNSESSIVANIYRIFLIFLRKYFQGLINFYRYITRLKKTEKDSNVGMTIEDFYDGYTVRCLSKFLLSHHYDVIIFEYLRLSYLLKVFSNSNAVKIVDTHDLLHVRSERYKKNNYVYGLRISKYDEFKLLNHYDYILAIQKKEYQILKNEFKSKVLYCPRPSDAIEVVIKPKQKKNIVFIASSADFNIDAISWFIDNVWNDNLANKFTLSIYGSICSSLPDFSLKSIKVYGKIQDITEAYINADICMNPVRFGSGLKIKNVEALSFGIPIITTSIGAEGLEGAIGNGLFICDSPDQFIETLYQLDNYTSILELSQKAKNYIALNFNENICFKELNNLLESL
jgi:glycosyltransferase involved in cell wall biosynthesis